jgi:hypothetical protein
VGDDRSEGVPRQGVRPAGRAPQGSLADYFEELLEQIREIRASERRFYQKVRDLFSTASADYDPAADTEKTFFATIQNELLYAVAGQAAAELVTGRADPTAAGGTGRVDLVLHGGAPEGRSLIRSTRRCSR